MPIEYATLNHAGDSVDNPIVEGLPFKITVEKHDATDTLKKAWVESPLGTVFLDITSLAVVTDTSISFSIDSSTHLAHGTPAELNIIHISTTSQKVKRGLYVVTAAWTTLGAGARLSDAESLPHRIKLDGYNGDNFLKPHIIHFSAT